MTNQSCKLDNVDMDEQWYEHYNRKRHKWQSVSQKINTGSLFYTMQMFTYVAFRLVLLMKKIVQKKEKTILKLFFLCQSVWPFPVYLQLISVCFKSNFYFVYTCTMYIYVIQYEIITIFDFEKKIVKIVSKGRTQKKTHLKDWARPLA